MTAEPGLHGRRSILEPASFGPLPALTESAYLRLEIHHRLSEVPAADWDALRPDDNPFLSHGLLSALEEHGCIDPALGWRPWHLVLYQERELLAALPCYLKANSHGEFVFDHAWAAAYHRHGLRYYPKLLGAVPYSPVTGPRLLCADPALRLVLAEHLIAEARRYGLSGAHLNFVQPDEAAALAGERWLLREDIQFHWQDLGFGNFDGFLASLSHKKRKNLRQDRQRVFAAGVRYRWISGSDGRESDWRQLHRHYLCTFADKGNTPALTEEFFLDLPGRLGDQVLGILAERHGRPLAGAWLLRSGNTLYGRYWGCTEDLPGLHFETCYHQGIELALALGLGRFEPGAQGEHKLARGFLPVLTRSLHHLVEPAFQEAVARALVEERQQVAAYRQLLEGHSPFRQASQP